MLGVWDGIYQASAVVGHRYIKLTPMPTYQFYNIGLSINNFFFIIALFVTSRRTESCLLMFLFFFKLPYLSLPMELALNVVGLPDAVAVATVVVTTLLTTEEVVSVVRCVV
jgi:hypothetical protein